ncbi:MAG: roadblock/LC7 domain-containing protein [Deltaproteobacteria bacterium]|nr:roadblock/LC7 domain-containing protein [Deltaproteobacteria bacterium]
MFRQTLEKILERCDGAIGGVLMGFDGIAVEAVVREAGTDVKTISAEFSFVLGQVRKAAEILEVGALNEVVIKSDNLVFLVRVLTDEYFVAIAMRPSGNFGKGRFLMRLADPELRAQL